MARGSVHECVACIRILKIENKITKSLYDKVYSKLEETNKMLSGLINTMLEKNNSC